MRALVFSLVLGVAGCTQLATPRAAPTLGQAPQGAQQAYFTTFPQPLFVAAAAVCSAPGQTKVQSGPDAVRCESLPDPESAAALILLYNGTVEDLPEFVIAFAGRDTAQGYLVTADNYIRVPHRDGSVQHIRFRDPVVENDLRNLLRSAGGRPL